VQCIDRNDEDCKKFGNFISWIEITMDFERQKLGLTHDQHVESTNSSHSITTFPLIAFYFLAHLWVINLLVQTLKKYKNTHSKEKMEIRSNLGWKYITLLIGDGTLVSNGYLYYSTYMPLRTSQNSNVYLLQWKIRVSNG